MQEALEAEKSERTSGRVGDYTRTLVTRAKLELRVPQNRDGRFSTELFEAISAL